jgi:tetratricopeptide (TPR) repeat protein
METLPSSEVGDLIARAIAGLDEDEQRPSTRRSAARTIPRPRRRSTTSPACCRTRATWRERCPCASVRWRSTKRSADRSIPPRREGCATLPISGAEGDLAGARPLLERSVAIYEKLRGVDHPSTARCLNHLASLLREQGDLAAARSLSERALMILEKALGPEHPDTAWSLGNMANLLEAQGDHAGAQGLYERALAIWEKLVGAAHPNTHRVRVDFARWLLAGGNAAQALAYGEAALAVHRQALREGHPWIKDSAAITAAALDASGRTEDAAALRARFDLATNGAPG